MATDIMNYRYEKIRKCFEDKNCSLVTTKNDLEEQYGSGSIKPFYGEKITYTPQCGHQNTCTYRLFNRKTRAFVCVTCHKNDKTTEKNEVKDQARETSANIVATQGMSNSDYISMRAKDIVFNALKDDLDVIKVNDNSLVDMIVKPILSNDDAYYGVKIKATEKKDDKDTYNFVMRKKDYQNCIIVCLGLDNNTCAWIFENHEMKEKSAIKIPYNSTRSALNKDHKIAMKDLSRHVIKMFAKNPDMLVQKNVFIGKEKEGDVKTSFKKLREKLPDLKIVVPDYKGIVYDFTLDGFKVKEKFGTSSFNMTHNGGYENGKYTKVPYKKGQFDFYWFNVKNDNAPTPHFFVIPENALITKGIVGEGDNIGMTALIMDANKNDVWYSDYRMNYEQPEESAAKIRALIENAKESRRIA